MAVIASTGGAVYRETCRRNMYIRNRIVQVVSDRPCGAMEAANEFGHAATQLDWKGHVDFSGRVLELMQARSIDLVVSFYTRLFVGQLLEEYSGRFVNFHPSILPACPGRDGFGDTLRSGSQLIGSTVHLVDRGTDTGWPVLQACQPRDPRLSETELRHQIFVQQCRSLVQLVHWFEQGRVLIGRDGVAIEGARYSVGEFAPNLDAPDAMDLRL